MGKIGSLALFAILVFVAVFAGCSQEDNLVVANDGASEWQGAVEDIDVTINPGASYRSSIYIGKTLGFIGPTEVGVLIEGTSLTTKAISEEGDREHERYSCLVATILPRMHPSIHRYTALAHPVGSSEIHPHAIPAVTSIALATQTGAL